MSEILEAIKQFVVFVQEDLISLAITLVGALLFYLFRAKVKLIYGRANNSLKERLINAFGFAAVPA
ncbi:hypothetical protein C1J05_01055 [Sulfitobacter sp. JL08]|uniref:hypothetical protein n=1 Tax=Sulfitobacter sp. JL08 TaxID=2070369 RepID=UPI000E0CA426|nr:hypothetical protein [Sulfitobacter sp. JL08]AXI53270.1 hypothetical protein C1J05_01055 [Sulfitobacter sp. JL08]